MLWKAAPAEMKRFVKALRASLRLVNYLQSALKLKGCTDTTQPLLAESPLFPARLIRHRHICLAYVMASEILI
jgi:hypothetical protein